MLHTLSIRYRPTSTPLKRSLGRVEWGVCCLRESSGDGTAVLGPNAARAFLRRAVTTHQRKWQMTLHVISSLYSSTPRKHQTNNRMFLCWRDTSQPHLVSHAIPPPLYSGVVQRTLFPSLHSSQSGGRCMLYACPLLVTSATAVATPFLPTCVVDVNVCGHLAP